VKLFSKKMFGRASQKNEEAGAKTHQGAVPNMPLLDVYIMMGMMQFNESYDLSPQKKCIDGKIYLQEHGH
jgi:hypothetical protein